MTDAPADTAPGKPAGGSAATHSASEHSASGEAATPRINGADPRWRELLDLDDRLFRDKGLRLLTPEARVLFHLSLSGAVTVTEAMQAAGTSYRGFYTVLERLKQAGLVASTKDKQDQRVRRLNVNPGRMPSANP